jgi:hypothetical protein
MTERQRGLLRLIEEAFRGVELGDGVSLHETVVLDDYGGPEERQAAREPDEKHDWRNLVRDAELVRPHSRDGLTGGMGGLTYYDAAGLRFHLPAYLSVVVTDPTTEGAQDVAGDLLFHLAHAVPSDFNRGRLALLSAAQRACVREVLKYLRDLLDSPDNGPFLADLDQAIEGFWSSG